MKKSIGLILVLLIASLFLFACNDAGIGTAEKENNNTAAYIKSDDNYSEDGTYIREHITVGSDSAIKRSDYKVSASQIGSDDTLQFSFFKINMTEKHDSRLKNTISAVVKKIDSRSYYKSDDEGNVIFAYTVSDLEVTSLLRETNQVRVGDVIKALESYAYSPDSPEEIYVSATKASFSHNVISGVLENDKEYIVLLWNADNEFMDPFICADGEKINNIVIPEECGYIVTGDIYPAWDEAYEEIVQGTFKDLCLPSENGIENWKKNYFNIINYYNSKN